MNTLEIYEKYYSKIPKTVFNKICKGDPTSHFKDEKLIKIGRYVKWLTKIYLENQLLLEDLDKSYEYLEILYSIRNTSSNVDIFKFDSLTTGEKPLYDFISNYIKPSDVNDESSLLINKFFIVNKQAELLYDDENWLVIIPKTAEASAFYASNTQWCTRFSNSFENYSKKGDLYIFIDKNKIERDIKSIENLNSNNDRIFQYHIQDNQFMNRSDRNLLTDSVLNISYKLLHDEFCKYFEFESIELEEYKNLQLKNWDKLKFETIVLFTQKIKNDIPITNFLNDSLKSKTIFQILSEYEHLSNKNYLKLINIYTQNRIVHEYLKLLDLIKNRSGFEKYEELEYKELISILKNIMRNYTDIEDYISILEYLPLPDKSLSNIIAHIMGKYTISDDVKLSIMKKYSYLNNSNKFGKTYLENCDKKASYSLIIKQIKSLPLNKNIINELYSVYITHYLISYGMRCLHMEHMEMRFGYASHFRRDIKKTTKKTTKRNNYIKDNLFEKRETVNSNRNPFNYSHFETKKFLSELFNKNIDKYVAYDNLECNFTYLLINNLKNDEYEDVFYILYFISNNTNKLFKNKLKLIFESNEYSKILLPLLELNFNIKIEDNMSMRMGGMGMGGMGMGMIFTEISKLKNKFIEEINIIKKQN